MKVLWIKLAIITATSLLLSCQTTNQKSKEDLKSEKGIIVSYINSGELSLALKLLNKNLAKLPRDAELNNLMGLTQLSLSNFDRAIHYFTISYKLDPKPLVKLNMSSAYLELGKYKEARNILTNLIRDQSSTSYTMKERLYHNLGYSYELTNDNDKAIKMYKQAVIENPTYHMSWLQLGRVYIKLKKQNDAIEAFKKAVSFCEPCIEPTEELYMTYMHNGQVLEAKSLLKKYLGNEYISTTNKIHAQKLMNRLTAKK